MAFIKRYSAIKKGGIIFTGNTLGLSKLSNLNRAGLQGSIGAFTSLNTSLRVNDFPFGTTLNYLQNGSAATLQLPPGSNVIYAELIWGGLYRSSVSNISNIINNAVTFTTPLTSVSVTGDGVTAQNFEIPLQDITVGFYVRTAIVTPYITAGGSGTYSLSAVPALIDPINNNTNDTNHAGWTLAVVYENQNQSFKSLNLWTGGTVVSPLTGVTDITLSGFKTPSTPSPNGKFMFRHRKETP